MANELIRELAQSPITHQGQRCVTLELIERLHERAKGTAKCAFRRRKDKFVLGKHYYVITLRELRDLGMLNIPKSPERGNPNQEVILLTEKGYLLLVKTFDDDLAWAVQEELIDGYFRVQAQPAQPHDLRHAVAEVLPALVSPILAEMRALLADAAPRLPQPMHTVKSRLHDMGWESASPRHRDQVRNLALAMIRQQGFPRPVAESQAPGAELLFPQSQLDFLDDAISAVWREARRREDAERGATGQMMLPGTAV